MNITEAFEQFQLQKLYYKGKSAKTISNYHTALQSFLRANPDLPVQFLAPQHVSQWERHMAKDGLAISTVASYLGCLRKVLPFVKKLGYNVMDAQDVELPKVKKNKVNFLYSNEVQKMINAAENPRDRALCCMMFSSGARISELLSLNRDSIRNGEAMITGKGDKEGIIDFDETALRYLEAYLETRTDRLRPLFISGQRRRLGYARANQIIHELSDLAGININVTTHTMRHSFATDLMFNGAHIMEIKEHLRHEDVSTTMRYLHVTDEHKKSSYKKNHTILK